VAVALVDARPLHGKSLNQAIQTVLQFIRLIANLQSLGLGAGGRHRNKQRLISETGKEQGRSSSCKNTGEAEKNTCVIFFTCCLPEDTLWFWLGEVSNPSLQQRCDPVNLT
jgi:hypothetical protein